MQTARKNVKSGFFKAVYGLFFILVAIIAIFLLPDWLSVGIIFFIAKYKIEIGYTVLALFALGTVYWLIKGKQQQNLKKKVYILLSLPFIIYACICLVAFLFPASYSRCDYYNQELNGGVKEFNGKKYTVNLCGTGADNMGSGDEVRLQVLDEKGELLAIRHFTVNWNESFPKVLEYSPDHITYYDNTGSDFDKRISIPPTAADWVRARLPLFN